MRLPLSPLGALATNIAGFDLDLRAELLHRHDMQIDRPRADGAAAGQRHLGLAAAGEQRPQHPEARPHLGDEFIRRRRIGDGVRPTDARFRRLAALARPLAVDRRCRRRDSAGCAAACGHRRSRGTLRSVSVSSLSSEAIIKGSAAFLAPLIGMVPLSLLPPRMRIRSMSRNPLQKAPDLRSGRCAFPVRIWSLTRINGVKGQPLIGFGRSVRGFCGRCVLARRLCALRRARLALSALARRLARSVDLAGSLAICGNFGDVDRLSSRLVR